MHDDSHDALADTIPRERRRGRRLDIARHVRFRLGPHPVDSIGRVANLTRGGLFVQTSHIMRPGLLIIGVFRTGQDSESDVVDFIGEVIWSTHYNHASGPYGAGFGTRFVRVSPDDQDAIGALLAPRRRLRWQRMPPADGRASRDASVRS